MWHTFGGEKKCFRIDWVGVIFVFVPVFVPALYWTSCCPYWTSWICWSSFVLSYYSFRFANFCDRWISKLLISLEFCLADTWILLVCCQLGAISSYRSATALTIVKFPDELLFFLGICLASFFYSDTWIYKLPEVIVLICFIFLFVLALC